MKKIANKKKQYIMSGFITLSFALSSLIESFSNKFIFIFAIAFSILSITFFTKAKNNTI
ncbi:hypothetical protein [Clostridium tarantellae]|uniref:hypothetical protein n=1 Tax=Clostridium tarantellae TaxID=39493 RepID=UPI0014796BE1|nr:hypothetical protein [Clostridium tarantellae]